MSEKSLAEDVADLLMARLIRFIQSALNEVAAEAKENQTLAEAMRAGTMCCLCGWTGSIKDMPKIDGLHTCPRCKGEGLEKKQEDFINLGPGEVGYLMWQCSYCGHSFTCRDIVKPYCGKCGAGKQEGLKEGEIHQVPVRPNRERKTMMDMHEAMHKLAGGSPHRIVADSIQCQELPPRRETFVELAEMPDTTVYLFCDGNGMRPVTKEEIAAAKKQKEQEEKPSEAYKRSKEFISAVLRYCGSHSADGPLASHIEHFGAWVEENLK
jgi:hypothetical protein